MILFSSGRLAPVLSTKSTTGFMICSNSGNILAKKKIASANLLEIRMHRSEVEGKFLDIDESLVRVSGEHRDLTNKRD